MIDPDRIFKVKFTLNSGVTCLVTLEAGPTATIDEAAKALIENFTRFETVHLKDALTQEHVFVRCQDVSFIRTPA